MSLFRDSDLGGLPGLRPVRPTRFGRLPPVQPGSRGGPMTRSSPGRRRRLFAWARAKDSPLRHVDWILVAAALALTAIGTLLVWSATQPVLVQQGLSPYLELEKQLLVVVLGIAFMIGASLIDYRQLRVIAPFFYAATLLGLLAVFTPFGTTVNGARSWILLPGGFEVEPSELAKLGLVLMTAVILSDLAERGQGPRLRHVALALGLGAVPLALVVRQPDLGVTVLMLVMLMGMIALSGIRARWLAGLTAAGVAAGFAVWQLHILQPYQLKRLEAFINPSSAATTTGYSALQSKIAIGSGGMFGQGLFHGQLVAGSFVPEQYTDFIFSVAGEELGFAGTITIVALLAVLLLRTLRIASRADDLFGLLVASGIAIWFGVQAFINIGMTIGIMPVTGLPLPFISYGGSAMFADMMAVGVLLSIHRRHRVFG